MALGRTADRCTELMSAAEGALCGRPAWRDVILSQVKSNEAWDHILDTRALCYISRDVFITECFHMMEYCQEKSTVKEKSPETEVS